MKILILSGTGTEIGKTSFALGLLFFAKHWGFKPVYWKTTQCGLREDGLSDAQWIEKKSSHGFKTATWQKFPDPVSPHFAAEKANKSLHIEDLIKFSQNHSDNFDLAILEGAGGIASPFSREGWDLADFSRESEQEVLLICPPGLGTLTASITSWSHLRNKKARIAGFAFSNTSSLRSSLAADNAKTIAQITGMTYWGELPYYPQLHDSSSCDDLFINQETDKISHILKKWLN